MLTYGRIFLLSGLVAALLPGQSGTSRPASVRATGEATVPVKPDQAKVDIGVLTQAQTAEAAASQNAAESQNVIAKLRAAAPKADIRTISYSVGPIYQYPRDGSKPTIGGYSAMNTVEVTLNDIAGIGKLMDAATQGGANQIQRLQFTVRDEKPARAEALRQASLEARSNAEAMAASLGLKLGPVISLEQGTPEAVRPVMPMMRAQTASVSTQVEPGVIEVRATVTLMVAVQ